MNTYLAFYRGRQTTVMSSTSYAAQQQAAKFFKARRECEVTVMLAEKDGQPVVHKPDF